MTTTYLLPCSCGEKVPVEPRQAGEVIKCSCGVALDAPTLLEMAALEKARPNPESRRSPEPWGVRQSLALLGAVILFAALGLTVVLLFNQPLPVEREKAVMSLDAIRRQTLALTPLQSRRVWQSLRATGPDGRMPFQEQIYDEMLGQYRQSLLGWWLSLGVVAVIGVVGLGLVAIPLWKK